MQPTILRINQDKDKYFDICATRRHQGMQEPRAQMFNMKLNVSLKQVRSRNKKHIDKKKT